MKKIIVYFVALLIITGSCQLGSRYQSETSGTDNQKGVVKDVIQTSTYTYLLVEKKKAEEWIAISKAEVVKGMEVYYKDGLEMKNFESKELGRTFDRILFVQDISDQPISETDPHGGMGGMDEMGTMMGGKPEKPLISKMDVQIDHPEGSITIGELYAKRADYAGKMVKVAGKVTKVNVDIMGKNWVHIQDGTADGDNFDLTITTGDEPAMGSIVTYSGLFTLKKDFGYGYFYEIIVEDAERVKEL